MVSKSDVLARLPRYENKVKLVTWRQSTDRLTKEILKAHENYESEYDLIYDLFDTGDPVTTAQGLWDFCKYNIPYQIEGEDEQSVKSPAAILQKTEKTDCKHYSLFIAGVLAAIQAHMGDQWTWCYRFAAYGNNPDIEHVFVVLKDGNKEYWIDPVLTGFNQRKEPTYYLDKEVMPIYSISGIGDLMGSRWLDVYRETAEIYFLVQVNQNCFGLKTLMNSNPGVTYGEFRDWYIGQGYDFNQLQLILNAA